jgi:hypothetical protein
MESQDEGLYCRQRTVGHCGSYFYTYRYDNDQLDKLDMKAKSILKLCLLDSILMNVSGEATSK